MKPALARALVALDGLSVGDALGQQLFATGVDVQTLPQGPWPWTDDTEMALSVVAELLASDGIAPDALARRFAAQYSMDRGYGPSMHRTLLRIGTGEEWREVSADAFGGHGSWGNGAAMRVAPLGAWFAGDPARAAQEAERSAKVTHGHSEAVAGAIAVAVAAAIAAAGEPSSLLPQVIARVPPSEVRSRLQRALELRDVAAWEYASRLLGNGTELAAHDTVPYALWCCQMYLTDFAAALALAVRAGGDRDTLGAICGGIVACRTGREGIPAAWLARREAWPDWFDAVVHDVG